MSLAPLQGPPGVHFAPSFFVPGYFAPSFFGPAIPPPPVILDIDNEVANFLATALGVPVFPEAIPEGTVNYPVLVYSIVDGDPYYRLDGPDGLAWIRYQFDSYSKLKSDVGQLNERLRLAMLPFMRQGGLMGLATIRNVTLHRPLSGFSPPDGGQESYVIYRRMSEYTIYFVQA